MGAQKNPSEKPLPEPAPLSMKTRVGRVLWVSRVLKWAGAFGPAHEFELKFDPMSDTWSASVTIRGKEEHAPFLGTSKTSPEEAMVALETVCVAALREKLDLLVSGARVVAPEMAQEIMLKYVDIPAAGGNRTETSEEILGTAVTVRPSVR